jgi:hypothetical protein
VKQRVYFFRCGITTDMSLISRRTGSLPLAGEGTVPFDLECPFALFVAGQSGTPPSRRRFLEAGSEYEGLGRGARPQM